MKKKISILAIICMTMSLTAPVYASELSTDEITQYTEDKNTQYVSYSIDVDENDPALVDAELIASTIDEENGRIITTNIYEQQDGTIITDELNVSAIATYSKNGSDTATRTRTISGWGSITITASFDWYTKGRFSYVRCSSMSAYYSMNSLAVNSKWDTSRTSDYVSIGKATAKVSYYFYNKSFPSQYQDGTFKVTCSDEGSISDN